MDNTITNRAADNIRILSAAMVEKAKSGHPGGAMGGADFINILYSEFLNYDPDKLDYPFRDRFFLDPGHMSPMLYSVLALAGIMPAEELQGKPYPRTPGGRPRTRDREHLRPARTRTCDGARRCHCRTLPRRTVR